MSTVVHFWNVISLKFRQRGRPACLDSFSALISDAPAVVIAKYVDLELVLGERIVAPVASSQRRRGPGKWLSQ